MTPLDGSRRISPRTLQQIAQHTHHLQLELPHLRIIPFQTMYYPFLFEIIDYSSNSNTQATPVTLFHTNHSTESLLRRNHIALSHRQTMLLRRRESFIMSMLLIIVRRSCDTWMKYLQLPSMSKISIPLYSTIHINIIDQHRCCHQLRRAS